MQVRSRAYFRSFVCTDKPQVSVAQKMYTVQDGKSLEIDCRVDANPPANAYWKPSKYIELCHLFPYFMVFSLASPVDDTKYKVIGNRLILNNLNHQLDGLVFQCSAQNNVGTSEPESIKLNVLCKLRQPFSVE